MLNDNVVFVISTHVKYRKCELVQAQSVTLPVESQEYEYEKLGAVMPKDTLSMPYSTPITHADGASVGQRCILCVGLSSFWSSCFFQICGQWLKASVYSGCSGEHG